ncbi:MAG: thioredoxin family protein [bacterium]|nr:thioredoxin family protein [bacterium]
MNKKTLNILAAIVLIAVLIIIIIVKVEKEQKEISDEVTMTDPPEMVAAIEPNSTAEEDEKTDPVEKPNPTVLEKGTIAIVNHFKITEKQLNDQFQSLPPAYKDEFKNDMEGFLDQLVVREILFQHAEQKGLVEDVETGDMEQRKMLAIEKLLKSISEQIQISNADIKNFYDDHVSEMRGASLDQVKINIQNYLVQQKQAEFINQTIEQLKKEAQLVYNEQWLNKQRALKPPNPLETAFKSGKPTVLDLGASSCIPCKMMKPIFAELEQTMKDKANIIILEISEHRDLARKYRVRVIPTQIFFDANGEVYWRNEGFLPKDAIINKLKEMGVQ